MFRKISAILICGLLVFTSCSKAPLVEEEIKTPFHGVEDIDFTTVTVDYNDIEVKQQISGKCGYYLGQGITFPFTATVKEVNVQRGDWVSKGDVLAVLDSSQLEGEILQQQNAVNSTTGIDREIQQGKLDILQNTKASYTIKAPMDGYIGDGNIPSVGGMVYESSYFLTISPSDDVFFYIETNSIAALRFGTEVDVIIENEPYSGTVIVAEDTVPLSVNNGKKGFAIIELSSQPENKKDIVGSWKEINVVTQKRHNVLTLPKSAISTFGGNDYVTLIDGGLRQEIPVRLGVADQDRVEIISGLHAGDEVLVG